MADLQLHTLLLCDYALTAQDGKISAIGVFSQINVARLPATHGRCFIVAILEASSGPHELSIQVVSPSGKDTLQQALRLRIEVPPSGAAAIVVRPSTSRSRDQVRPEGSVTSTARPSGS